MKLYLVKTWWPHQEPQWECRWSQIYPQPEHTPQPLLAELFLHCKCTQNIARYNKYWSYKFITYFLVNKRTSNLCILVILPSRNASPGKFGLCLLDSDFLEIHKPGFIDVQHEACSVVAHRISANAWLKQRQHHLRLNHDT